MAVQFRALNDDNTTVQIDTNYRNLFLRQSGSVTTVSGGLYSYSAFNVAGVTAPVIAIGGSAYAMAYCSKLDTSTGQFLIMSAGAAGTVIPYYIFDTAPSPTGPVGLKLFDATARCIFDSNQKSMRVVDMQLVTGAPGGTYPAGRTYACVHSIFGLREETRASPYFRLEGTRFVGTTLSSILFEHHEIPPSPIVTNIRFGSYLVLDVTGY